MELHATTQDKENIPAYANLDIKDKTVRFELPTNALNINHALMAEHAR